MISQNNFVVLEVKQNLRRYWLMAWDIISAAIKTFFDRVPNFNISSFQNLFLRWRLNRSFWGKVRMILAAPDNMPMTPNILDSVCCISQIPNNWEVSVFLSLRFQNWKYPIFGQNYANFVNFRRLMITIISILFFVTNRTYI